MRKFVGARIRYLRTSKTPKMTREKLSELVGVNPMAVYNWEIGKYFPEEKNLQTLAKALGVSIADLLQISEPQNEITNEMIFNKLKEIEKMLKKKKKK